MVKLITDVDLPEIHRWHEARQAPFNPGFLPEHGWWVPGVAAGWLWLVENRMAMLDSFISNPVRPGKERRAALSAIIETMKTFAWANSVEKVFCLSQNPRIAVLCQQHGLDPKGTFTLYGKEL